ncbi:DUF3817 domain-containing protein [Rothia sp. ZJ932]|uniref:DUF3817 domain-containing protein n=1 Tax=Rothia sp. ZJ932 TaxID=2810516 RepID=UPI00196703AA|nr:DUF3817 domain-containing protein [Rothia sp. ZJ932]QRZ61541.1 DUF3817 domain-containing protein [Rothia sp. ZJ932]
MNLTPRTLFSIFATAEAITWAGLIAAIISRATGVADFVSTAGSLHGFVFLSYVAVTLFVWVNQQWKTSVGITGILLSVIPFATVPYEIYLKKRGLLTGGWRLAPGGETPRGFIEKVQAWVLRKPLLATAVLLGVIVVVYVALLLMGPPVPQN